MVVAVKLNPGSVNKKKVSTGRITSVESIRSPNPNNILGIFYYAANLEATCKMLELLLSRNQIDSKLQTWCPPTNFLNDL
jgi:hypothetical protein